MNSPSVKTVIKMLESLPLNEQDRVVDHIKEYILELQDEEQWNKEFVDSKERLIDAAKKARQEIAKGNSKPLAAGDL